LPLFFAFASLASQELQLDFLKKGLVFVFVLSSWQAGKLASWQAGKLASWQAEFRASNTFPIFERFYPILALLLPGNGKLGPRAGLID
jgi:hypothetical protein